MLKLLFSSRWRWATLIVIVGMAVMVRLGIWQLDRLAQRRAANAELAAALAAPARPLPDLLAETDDLSLLMDREVLLTGQFDFDAQLILLLQNWQGQAGVHLLTPMRLADGETAVLVDRGWIPDSERENLAAYNQPQGQTTVTAVITAPELLRGQSVIPDTPQTEWYRVDVPAIAQQLPYSIETDFYVKQLPPTEGLTTLPYQAERVIDLSEGPHLSYAIQWFAFTLMLGGGYLAFVRRNSQPEAHG